MRKLLALLVLIPSISFADQISEETLKQINKSIQELTKAIKEHTKAIQNSALTNSETNWNN